MTTRNFITDDSALLRLFYRALGSTRVHQNTGGRFGLNCSLTTTDVYKMPFSIK